MVSSTRRINSLKKSTNKQLVQQQPELILKTDLITPIRFIPISTSELSLPAILKCGQTFRWIQSRFRIRRTHKELIRIKEEDEQERTGLETESTVDLEEWSMGWNDRTVVLRQDNEGLHYVSLYPPNEVESFRTDLKFDTTLEKLKKYFALEVSLVDLYKDWSSRDPNFLKKVSDGRFDGLRVCKQDPWETVVSFICSSNNNIPRITMMLNRVCASFGNQLPSPPIGVTLTNQERLTIESDLYPISEMPMYSFPTPRRLSQPDVLDRLKQLGFGYRANYVWKTSLKLCEISDEAKSKGRWSTHPGSDSESELSDLTEIETESGEKSEGEEEDVKVRPELENWKGSKKDHEFEPVEFLNYLSNQTYKLAHQALIENFAGVGPKVSDCICLFGLGFVGIVPVDVHVYQIAIRDYKVSIISSQKRSKKNNTKAKKLGGADEDFDEDTGAAKKNGEAQSNSLSKLNYDLIQSKLHDLWGPWAGWAQQILFLADLKYDSIKINLDKNSLSNSDQKPKKRKKHF
ncbi:DNA glycosylase [Phakopsora pachyrhizi]|uniref:DNA-(apurinic or apyrimidinic site) lyase n=1 Tax=Phakopsora pachyrhizi TaxID=170000 RepID=A0AAV0AM99_PHAPC|nr:DNA glycosylase [Phakopsora pachyrhizi]